jgi:hypothetical protein
LIVFQFEPSAQSQLCVEHQKEKKPFYIIKGWSQFPLKNNQVFFFLFNQAFVEKKQGSKVPLRQEENHFLLLQEDEDLVHNSLYLGTEKQIKDSAEYYLSLAAILSWI